MARRYDNALVKQVIYHFLILQLGRYGDHFYHAFGSAFKPAFNFGKGGFFINFSGCAPFFAGFRYGPSRCKPQKAPLLLLR
jgi:hypothetical protein